MAFAPSVAHKPVAAAVCPVMAATEALATEGGLEARGAIFTRSEVGVVSENGKNRTLSTAKKLVMDRHATVAGRACPLLSCP